VSLTTALEALTADANRWDGVAQELTGAANAADRLALSEKTFSFAGSSVAASYEAVRAYVEQLLRSGASETTGAAAELRRVRTAYESADEAARAALRGLWSWEE